MGLVPRDQFEAALAQRFKKGTPEYNEGIAAWEARRQQLEGGAAAASPPAAKTVPGTPQGNASNQGTDSDWELYSAGMEGFRRSSLGKLGAKYLGIESLKPTQFEPSSLAEETAMGFGGAAVPLAAGVVAGGLPGWAGGMALERGLSKSLDEGSTWGEVGKETLAGAAEGAGGFYGGKVAGRALRPLTSRIAALATKPVTQAGIEHIAGRGAEVVGEAAGLGVAGSGVRDVEEHGLPMNEAELGGTVKRTLQGAHEGMPENIGISLAMELARARRHRGEIAKLAETIRNRPPKDGGGAGTATTGEQTPGAGEGAPKPGPNPPDGGGGGGGGGGAADMVILRDVTKPNAKGRPMERSRAEAVARNDPSWVVEEVPKGPTSPQNETGEQTPGAGAGAPKPSPAGPQGGAPGGAEATVAAAAADAADTSGLTGNLFDVAKRAEQTGHGQVIRRMAADGMPPEEIAKQLGLPILTVRTILTNPVAPAGAAPAGGPTPGAPPAAAGGPEPPRMVTQPGETLGGPEVPSDAATPFPGGPGPAAEPAGGAAGPEPAGPSLRGRAAGAFQRAMGSLRRAFPAFGRDAIARGQARAAEEPAFTQAEAPAPPPAEDVHAGVPPPVEAPGGGVSAEVDALRRIRAKHQAEPRDSASFPERLYPGAGTSEAVLQAEEAITGRRIPRGPGAMSEPPLPEAVGGEAAPTSTEVPPPAAPAGARPAAPVEMGEDFVARTEAAYGKYRSRVGQLDPAVDAVLADAAEHIVETADNVTSTPGLSVEDQLGRLESSLRILEDLADAPPEVQRVMTEQAAAVFLGGEVPPEVARLVDRHPAQLGLYEGADGAALYHKGWFEEADLDALDNAGELSTVGEQFNPAELLGPEAEGPGADLPEDLGEWAAGSDELAPESMSDNALREQARAKAKERIATHGANAKAMGWTARDPAPGTKALEGATKWLTDQVKAAPGPQRVAQIEKAREALQALDMQGAMSPNMTAWLNQQLDAMEAGARRGVTPGQRIHPLHATDVAAGKTVAQIAAAARGETATGADTEAPVARKGRRGRQAVSEPPTGSEAPSTAATVTAAGGGSRVQQLVAEAKAKMARGEDASAELDEAGRLMAEGAEAAPTEEPTSTEQTEGTDTEATPATSEQPGAGTAAEPPRKGGRKRKVKDITTVAQAESPIGKLAAVARGTKELKSTPEALRPKGGNLAEGVTTLEEAQIAHTSLSRDIEKRSIALEKAKVAEGESDRVRTLRDELITMHKDLEAVAAKRDELRKGGSQEATSPRRGKGGRAPDIFQATETHPTGITKAEAKVADRIRKKAKANATPEEKRAAYKEYRDTVVKWLRENRVPKHWADKELQGIRSEMESIGLAEPATQGTMTEGEKILPRNVRTPEERAADERVGKPLSKDFEDQMRAWIDKEAPAQSGESVEARVNRLHDLDQQIQNMVKEGRRTAEQIAEPRRVLAKMVSELRGRPREESAPGSREATIEKGAEPTLAGKPEDMGERTVTFTTSRKAYEALKGQYVRFVQPNGKTRMGQVTKWNRNQVGIVVDDPSRPVWVSPDGIKAAILRDKPTGKKSVSYVWDEAAGKLVPEGGAEAAAAPSTEAQPGSEQRPAKTKNILGKAARKLKTQEGQGMREQMAALRSHVQGENVAENPPPSGAPAGEVTLESLLARAKEAMARGEDATDLLDQAEEIAQKRAQAPPTGRPPKGRR